MKTLPEPGRPGLAERMRTRSSRRSFLKWSGATLAAVGLVACDDDVVAPPDLDPSGVTLDFSTDVGVLNYAYALEQLEAAFYAQVVASLYAGATAEEERILTDLRDHEAVHRDLFMAALGSNAIGGLTPDFSAVDFGSRASVLGTARTFEDLGVAAYNGAGKYLGSAAFLTVAGKIVSVEARHASAVRTLAGEPFAPAAFDQAMAPGEVLAAAGPFIQNPITLRNA